MGNAGSAHNLQNDGIQNELNLCYTQEYLRRTTAGSKKKNISVLGGWSGGRNMVDCTVLPKPNENIKLRPTTNGAILHAGGTISFRAKEQAERNKSTQFLPMRRCHTLILDGQNDIISQHKSASAVTEFRRSQTLILVGHNKRNAQENYSQNEDYHSLSIAQSTSALSTLKVNKYNKKRKAPPAPSKNSSKDDDTSRYRKQLLNEPKSTTLAKPRIYTTNTSKALPTQKQLQSPSAKVTPFKRDSYIRTSVNSVSQIQHSNSSYASKLPYRREKSFDAKLLTQNKLNDSNDIKISIETRKKLNSNNNKLENDNRHSSSGMKRSTIKPDNVTIKKGVSTFKKTYHSEAKAAEDSAQEKTTMLTLNKKTKNKNFTEFLTSPNERKLKCPPQSRIPQLKRTFYFGMESSNKFAGLSSAVPTDNRKNKKTLEENIDLPVLNNKMQEEETIDNGILVHIRPTLPRRQLEAPSFSPVVAWRNLVEEKIQLLKIKQNSVDRLAEMPICLQTTAKDNYASDKTDWIPQQDLKDDDEKEIQTPQNYINSLHVFSLSLPRDVHLQYKSNAAKENNYQEKNLQSANCWLVPGFNSLQKFKTQLGKSTDFHTNTKCTCAGKNSYKHNNYQLENYFADSFATESKRYHNPGCELNKTSFKPARYQTDNWLLDKSKDNPLNNDNERLHESCLKTSNPSKSLSCMNFQPKSLSNICTGKHIVYLPGQGAFFTSTKDSYNNSKPNKTNKPNYKKQRQRQENIRESLQDVTPIQNIHQSNVNVTEKNTHRFSFQSTVRVLEKRRLAEKLSKDAEIQEAQRLHELEAIKRVEEDFQRKRAPEKANLRNQLRLHFKATTENSEYRSLPLNINEKISSQYVYNHQLPDANNNLFFRAEPDGAVSQSAELNDNLPKERPSNCLLTSTKTAKDLDCLEYDAEESESETQLPNLQCNALLIEPYLNSLI